MRITHPQSAYQGLPPEDVFFVHSDSQIQMGVGFVMPFVQAEMYPQEPMHVYLSIEGQSSARGLLLGALIARADVLRAASPYEKARMYTTLDPREGELVNFYLHNGFKADDAEEVFRFPVPQAQARAPMGCQFATVPLRNAQEEEAFLQRMNSRRIQPLTRDYLTLCMQQRYFQALGIYRGGAPLCEALFSGSGRDATLASLYTDARYRRQGFAKALLVASAEVLRPLGATGILTQVFSRNFPQQSLMRSMNAQRLRVTAIYPGMEL